MLPPKDFFDRMKNICPDIDALEASYSQPPFRAIRINPLKIQADKADFGFELSALPFSPLGFAVADDDLRLGRSPWHHAGAYYVQEPAAMSAVTALEPQPGEYILDMCAAPGGKSTQIASLMDGQGLLWCNEYVRNRAQSLISNIERMGITNAVVSSLGPETIAETLEGFFDRVLVDAPCSGEGMFRKEEAAIREWSVEHVHSCANRQAAILDCAARCVRPGGVLVYSTCTFAPEENENNILSFLKRHSDFQLEPITASFGRQGISISDEHDLTLTRRIYPMDGGEGHFVARMRRSGNPETIFHPENQSSVIPDDVLELLNSCFYNIPSGIIRTIGDDIYLLPPAMPEYCRLPVLRAGVLAGTRRKNRIEPAHALFMASKAENCRNIINLQPDSPELNAFLHGETISVDEQIKGWCAASCGGIVTGFGKCSGGVLKNHYPKGLRLLN